MAQIVREVTDDGRRIVEFYLGVAEGTIDGFRDHHRAAAARRLDKIAPGLVAEYLVKYAPAHLRDSYRGMGSIAPMKKETGERDDDAPRRSNASGASSPSSSAMRPATAAPSSTSWPA